MIANYFIANFKGWRVYGDYTASSDPVPVRYTAEKDGETVTLESTTLTGLVELIEARK